MVNRLYDQEILPTNYCIFHQDRHPRGGGAMIAVRDTISATVVKAPAVPATNLFEAISVNLMLHKPITICCIYNPPCSDNLQVNEIMQYLSALLQSTSPTIAISQILTGKL